MRPRYEVTEVNPLSKDTRVFKVRKTDWPEWRSVEVWYSDAVIRTGRANCTQCQGTLTAMSSSCPHSKAVKRHVAKSTGAKA